MFHSVRAVNSARLIYTVGPSGAGKDSLLAWLRLNMPAQFYLHFAQRCITRAMQADGEVHESVDVETFRRLRESNAFVLNWGANGLHYGVRREELLPLQRDQWVIVNGSRAYLAEAQSKFPELRVLHISASRETLRQRLQARGRETPDAIESRIERAAGLSLPPGTSCIEICNDGHLEEAGCQMIDSLRGWIAV